MATAKRYVRAPARKRQSERERERQRVRKKRSLSLSAHVANGVMMPNGTEMMEYAATHGRSVRASLPLFR